MKVNDYQAQAKTTALYRDQIAKRYRLEPDFNAKERDLVDLLCKDYVVSGFCGEVGEFLEDLSVGEAGGMLWYCAAIATEYHMSLSEAFEVHSEATFNDIHDDSHYAEAPLKYAAVLALKMQNAWKKHLRDGREFDPVQPMNNVIRYIVAHLNATNTRQEDAPDFLLVEAARYNLEQLADRAKRDKIQGDGNNR